MRHALRTIRLTAIALPAGVGAVALSSPAAAAGPVLEQQEQDGLLIELLRAVGDLLQQLVGALL